MSNVDPSVVRASARWIAVRQGLGVLVSGISLVAITRIAGPAQYGVYSAGFSIWFGIQAISEIGLDVWVVRRNAPDQAGASRTAQTLLLGLGIVGSLICLGVAAPAASASGLVELGPVLAWMAPLVAIVTVSQVALSTLERRFRFGAIGAFELIGQAAFGLVGVGTSLAGFGALGLVAALAVQQVFLATTWFVLTRGEGRKFGFQRAFAVDGLRFGAPSATSSVVSTIRTTAAQILVARFAGAGELGVLNLALRVLEQSAFLRTAALRLSLALFGRLAHQPQELGAVAHRGAILLLFAAGLPGLVATLLAPWLIPTVFGDKWTEAVRLLPLLLPGNLLVGLLGLYGAIAAARNRPASVLLAVVAYAGTYVVVLLGLTAHLGLVAVAVAEVTAIVGVVILAFKVRPAIGVKALLTELACVSAIGLAGQANTLGPWSILALGFPLFIPGVRTILAREISQIIARLQRFRHPQPGG